MKNSIFKISSIIFLLTLASCSENFLEPTLSTSKDVSTSVNTVEDLQGLLIGALDEMNGATYYGRDFVVFAEVRSDNAYSNGNSGRFVGPGQFFLNPTDAYPSDTWTTMYQAIANLNIIINATLEDEGDGQVAYVKGQAHALRGLVYMDLLRLYGQQNEGGTLGVPLITTFNDGNIFPERATIAETWQQITTDLEQAVALMDPDLDDEDNALPGYYTALALQSRAYLYTEEWAKARDAAKAVIDGGNYDLGANSWTANGSSDNIFELAYLPSDNLGNTSLFFIYQNTVYGDISVTQDLFDIYDANDVRATLFNGGGANELRTSKYDDAGYLDNIRVIRYAEVLLNYAEALTQLGDPNALAALNVVPAERGADLYADATIDNVLLERRKELAMEGHRFFDLMRYERGIVKVDPGQTFPNEGIPFGDGKLTFPIPEVERNANPNIVQNKEY